MHQVVLDLAELFLGQRYKTWYRLQQHDKGDAAASTTKKDSKKEKDLGKLQLKVQCHEERILDSQLYTPFVQLMLKTVEHPNVSRRSLLETYQYS